MKALVTCDTAGGVWTYALELGRALTARGLEVTLAALGPPPRPSQRRELAHAGLAGTCARACALEWMDEPWADVEASGGWLLELAARVRPDVVHVNGYAHAALPFGAPVVVGAHSDVCTWFEAVRRAEPPPAFDRYRRTVAAGLAAADAVVTPTAALLAGLRRFHRFDAPARVIPNGRRLRVGAVAKEPFVLAAGRLWDEAKNLDALDRAASRLRWPVRAAGPLGDRRARRVQPLGTLSAAGLAATMARASIFAAPAHYEPFGLAALEAALSGCALVLGDLPSLREVWGDAALYADPRDADALTAALELLTDDADRRSALARAARARAARYTPERLAERTLAVYDALAGEERAAA